MPFPLSTFGELSTYAFVDDACTFYSARQQLSFGESRNQLMQRIETALMQQIGKRLLATCTVLEPDATAAVTA